jgi:cyclic pyranopterin phosphate synthase
VIAPSAGWPKRPLSLRISVTDRCQLRCRYCMPAEGLALSDRRRILRYEELALLVQCLQQEWDVQKVRISGGEPLVRRDIERFVATLASLRVPDISLTTNGQLLKEKAERLAAAGLHRVNISLDSLNEDTFRWLSQGGLLTRTLAGIESACDHGLQPVKLNMVILRGVNDAEVVDALRFALARKCEMRFLELMPMGPATAMFDQWFTPWTEVRDRLSRAFKLRPLEPEPGSSARRYAVESSGGDRGIAGFITPWSEPFCAGCNRVRITADGRLHGCLAQAGGADIGEALRGGDVAAVARTVHAALAIKQMNSRFNHGRMMAATGG